MKKIIFAFSVLLVYSCGNKETNSGESYADISIEADTVVVDSGGEILMAATNGFGHAHSSDLGVLYNWDFKSSQVEYVDLTEFRLLKKLPFEKDGPDGVGQNSYLMRMFGDTQFAFISWDNVIIITDLEGKVVERMKLDEPWMTEGLEEKGSINFMGFSNDRKKIYCSFMNFKKLETDVLELNLESKTQKVYDLPEFEKLDKFRIAWTNDEGNSMSMSHPNISLQHWQGKLLFYTNALNSVYILDPKTDSLQLKSYNNLITANEKTGTYKNEVTSMEEMRDVSRSIQEEVNFTRLVWDDENKLFYRFTYIGLPKIADEEIKTKSFVSILSPDLKLLGEKEITDLGFKFPNPQFVKDGKIYLFLNLDDELAYVRLSVK
ncbi:DUF4221 domain-containing protein [Aquiflexum sp. TKW24L]|uniref:DUF4221 family protein n=1 Tax=Aquiflexum sp. TKW24L TaxID=2942212 RepID=UPI0020C08DAE|nr:DUF4221 family protein [Aquiflexum sp. TKW24L]MCL6260050.1 DUF4221 domain-containing protein [Aquiflexum sp. TKW24L]